MTKKILFINPPGISLGYNIGLCYIAALLKKNGFMVKIIDFLNHPGNENKRLLQAKDYDVVGVSVKTLVMDEAIKVMRKVKEINPDATLVCGGVHISLDGYKFMKENEIFDVGFINDSEESVLDFVKGKSLEKINGVIYRKKESLVVNPKKEFRFSLDELPFPDFDSFDVPVKMIGNYPLLTSRGCPYNCTYCTVQIVSKKWKARSVESLISELERVKHRIKEFYIVDDNFILDKKRIKEFCRRLIDEGFNLRWSCPNGLRADILDEELARLMKESGCYMANLGIESLDEEVFRRINKGESLDDVKRAIKILKKAGIGVIGNFIIGLPGSTFKIDMHSVKMARKLGLDVSLWYPLSLYPQTPVYEESIKDENVKFIKDWKEGFKYNFKGKPILSFERKDYKASEMARMFFIANLKSRSYGILIDPKKSLVMRSVDLLGIILKYDPFYIFNHIFNAFIVLMKYRKIY